MRKSLLFWRLVEPEAKLGLSKLAKDGSSLFYSAENVFNLA